MQLSASDLASIREQIKEMDFKAGREDYEIFLASEIWEDFSAFLEERIASVRGKLEDLANSHDADIIYKSRLHELRQLLRYPIHVIELLNLLEEDNVTE
jgi:hypothetical protein